MLAIYDHHGDNHYITCYGPNEKWSIEKYDSAQKAYATLLRNEYELISVTTESDFIIKEYWMHKPHRALS